MRWRKQQTEPSAFEQIVIEELPNVFSGLPSTIGNIRDMAQRQVDGEADTPTEAGLAITLLCVLKHWEQSLPQEP